MASKRIAVLGGGISGLSSAYYLAKAREEQDLDFEITLLEREKRLGGVMRSELINGLLLEAGPEGWASYKPWAKRLAVEIGLGESLLGSNDQFRKTLIVRDGLLKALPDGMMFLAPVDPLAFWKTAPLTLRGKLRASLEPMVSRSRGDLSVRRFFERRLGREFAEKLVEPLISGVYGADYEQLSAPSALPELHRAEQRAGSLWWGLRRFARMSFKVSVLMSLREGMEELPRVLSSRLPDEVVSLGAHARSVSRQNGAYSVRSDEMDGLFDYVVVCTPAYAAGPILEALSSSAAAGLSGLPYSSSTLIYLVYDRRGFDHDLGGFGFIVPRSERLMVNACTWVNTKFSYRCPEDRVLLRCAIHSDEAAGYSDEQLASRAAEEIQRVMSLSTSPIEFRVYRTPRSIPQLLLGHKSRVESIQDELRAHPGVILAGSYVGGVGIPDCVRTGEGVARRIVSEITGEVREGS